MNVVDIQSFSVYFLTNSDYLRWFPVFLKRISVLVTSFAVLLGGLTFGAAPASAAISGAGIDPSTWAAGSTVNALVTWTESDATANDGTSQKSFANGGQYLSVEVGWGWTMASKNPSNAAVPYTASWSAGTKQYSCNTTPPIVFSSPGFGGAGEGNIECLVRRSSNDASNPGQQVVLSNTDSEYFTLAAGSTITVGFVGGQVTAPASGPAADTWRIISLAYGGGSTTGKTTTVRTVVPGPDGALPEAPPTIRLDINGNGGVCTPSFVEGEQGTWSTAPTADKCTFGSRKLIGFSTSPTLAPGSVFVPPGGDVYFLTANLLYAIWAATPASAPQEVVATAGVNEVTITWKAPADLGASSILNYLVQANPSGRVCVTSTVRDQNPLTCTMSLAATNTKYTFDVQALNAAGWGEKSAASNAVSPYNLVLRDVSRSQDRILFIKTGSTLNVTGRAPGVPQGTVVTPQIKIGNGQWASETRGLPKVGRDQSITWSKKFKKSINNQPVQVRLTVLGASAEATPVKIGMRAGVPTASRNVKVTFTEARIPSQRRVQVSWEASANDGGSPITFYEVSLRVREDSLPATCRVPAGKKLTCTLNTGVLERRKKYTVNVTATNTNGRSNPAKVDFRQP